jgi:hypothetical protein
MLATLVKSASWTKIYDQDLEKMKKMKTKIHYEFFKIKIPTTRHKWHFEFQYEFKP